MQEADHDDLKGQEEEDAVVDWSTGDVAKWLNDKGFGKHAEMFVKHRVDGSMLFELTHEDLVQIGVKRVGARMQLMSLIEGLHAENIREHASHLKVPSWPTAMVQFFTFKWATTSEGKKGQDMKDEITQANLAISLVAALLTAVCYEWFMNVSSKCFCLENSDTGAVATVNSTDVCYCSTGYDLDDGPLKVFFFMAGMSSVLFLCATVVSILQIIMINEMSDEAEIVEFFELLDAYESLPGQLVAFGLFWMLIAQLVYCCYNSRLGALGSAEGDEADAAKQSGTLLAICFVVLMLYSYYVIARMIRTVYKAKGNAAASTKVAALAKMQRDSEMQVALAKE